MKRRRVNDKHYEFYFLGFKLDFYRIVSIYTHITAGEHQHILKKALRMGLGQKPLEQEIDEVEAQCVCWRRRLAEDKEIARHHAG